jgi:hypothetical protein
MQYIKRILTALVWAGIALICPQRAIEEMEK